MQSLRGHSSAVCSLALDADETLAAAGATDGTIRLFDLGTGCGAGACSPNALCTAPLDLLLGAYLHACAA